MSIIRMKKVAVIGLDTVKEKLISDLMEAGVVQITDQGQRLTEDEGWKNLAVRDGDESRVTALDAEINRVSIALDTLERYSTAKSPLFFTRKAMEKSAFAETVKARQKLFDDVQEVLKRSEEMHKLREKINKRQADLAAVTPWVSYDLPLELTETRRTVAELGVVPSTANMDTLTKRVYDGRETVVLTEMGRDKDLIYLVVITMKEEQENVMTILKQHGFTPVPFAGWVGTAEENRLRIIKEIHEAEERLKQVEKEIESLYSLKDGIACLYDELVIERDRERVLSKLLKTKRTFNLEGWVPEPASDTVDKILSDSGCCYAYRDPKDGENVPVLTSNSSLVYPFESVMEMYSLPDYRGIDPTKYFALFYAMFFGIMLSDAGYGLVIAIACFVVLRKFALEGMTYRMIKMFMYCGISTVFWGAMFGGWFGDFFQVAARTIFHKEITIQPLWFNPIEDPTRLLIWSLVFGVVHLFLGMGIKASMLIKRGQWKDAVFDVFSWYLVILGAAMWLAGGSLSEALVKPGMYMAIAGALILLLTGGRDRKGVGKIIGGLSSLYDVTGYISDILSYSRLLALGLATGVIATVVNTMGSLMGGGVAGTIVLLVVFVIGHTFNLAINALGAFVHSSRLQYIEFFGKFYEDGGEEFEPFRKNTKYVRLTNESNGGKK
ncbi:V-type ATP synthase subunit I [Ihubacter sp. rT4E-8]|uniref:V-type ATP synthase subunit I n=1 Tax=Ihubacter sp. rT4E-8 TaxID=3242369 RepID=UPI003CF0F66B